MMRIIFFLVVSTIACSTVYGVELQADNQQPNNFCQGCRSLVSYVSHFNSSINRDKYQQVLRGFCESYYPPSTDYRQGPCPLFVESAFHVLANIDPVLHCDQIGACGHNVIKFVANNDIPPRSNKVVCDVCEQVVTDVKMNLEDPQVIGMVRKQIAALCDYLKVVGEDEECKRMSNKYLDEAIDFIKHLDPLKYCQAIKMCTSNQAAQKNQEAQKPELVKFENFGLEVRPSETKISSNTKKVTIEPMCKFCKTFVKYMFDFLKDKKTEQSVRDALDSVCEVFYKQGPGRQHCEDLIATYSKELVELLIDETDPEVICMILQQCGLEREEIKHQIPINAFVGELSGVQEEKSFDFSDLISMLDPSKIQAALKPELVKFENFGLERESSETRISSNTKKVTIEPMCKFCKTFVKIMFDFLKDKKTEQSVRDALDSVCKLFYKQGPGRQHCEDLVATYSKELVELLVNETDPEVICMILQQCALEREENRHAVVGELGGVLGEKPVDLSDLISMLDPSIPPMSYKTCLECKIFIKFLREKISESKNQEEVRLWLLNNLCAGVPDKQLKNSCIDLVNNYSETFFKAVVEDLNPKESCVELRACKKRSKLLFFDTLADELTSSALLTAFGPQISIAPPASQTPVAVSPKKAVPLEATVCNQCIDIVGKIDEYLSAHPIDQDVSILIDQVCNKLPNDSAKNICTVMIKTFGDEIAQSISTMDNPRQLCTKISLC